MAKKRQPINEPMTLERSDYDQASRYLQYACELLEAGGARQNGNPSRDARGRGAPTDARAIIPSGMLPAEITVPRQVAEKVPVAGARTEILEVVAVLRDKRRQPRLLSERPFSCLRWGDRATL